MIFRELSHRHRSWVLAFAAILCSLIFSFLVYPLLQQPLGLSPDPDRNGELGANLYSGRGYVYNGSDQPAVDRGPVYPYFLWFVFLLAGGVKVWAVQIAQALLHGGMTLLIYATGRRLFSERIALTAQLVSSAHPVVLWYTARIWIETTHIFLIALVAFSVVLFFEHPSTARSLGTGVSIGLALLTKAILLLFPVVLIVIVYAQYRGRGLRQLAIALGVMTAIVAPWTIRNYALTGKLLPVHTSIGLNLTQGDALGMHWQEKPFSCSELWLVGKARMDSLLAGTSYTAQDIDGDRLLASRSIEYSAEHPLFFIKRTLLNMLTFMYLSESPLKSIFLIFLQLPLYYFVLRFLIHQRKIRPQVLPLGMLIFYFYIVHALIIGWARYSAPIVPLCILLATAYLMRSAPLTRGSSPSPDKPIESERGIS